MLGVECWEWGVEIEVWSVKKLVMGVRCSDWIQGCLEWSAGTQQGMKKSKTVQQNEFVTIKLSLIQTGQAPLITDPPPISFTTL